MSTPVRIGPGFFPDRSGSCVHGDPLGRLGPGRDPPLGFSLFLWDEGLPAMAVPISQRMEMFTLTSQHLALWVLSWPSPRKG